MRTLPGCAENSTTNNAHIIPNTFFPLIMRLNSTFYLSLSGSLHALLLRGKKKWNKDHVTVQMCRRLLLSSPAYFSYLDTFPHQIMLIWGVNRGHCVVLEIGARQETVFWEKPTDTSHAQNSLPTSVKLQYYFYFLWALGCRWLQTRRLNLKTSGHDSFSWCRHIFQLSVTTSAEGSSAYLPTCRSDFQYHVPTSLVLLQLLVGVTQWTSWGGLGWVLFFFFSKCILFWGGSVLSLQTDMELYQPSQPSCALRDLCYDWFMLCYHPEPIPGETKHW